MLGPELRHILEGGGAPAAFEPMFPLVTIEPAGHPWPCYLSRREVLAAEDRCWTATASTRLARNLGFSPQAALLLVGTRCAYTLALEAERWETSSGGVLLTSWRLSSVEEDGVGTALMPMAFAATDDLIRREGADDHTDLLARFAAQHGLQPAMTATPPAA
jgi:hypothetical protein